MRNSNSRFISIRVSALLSIAVLLFLAGCFPSGGQSQDIADLAEIEVREYQGKDLSSITAFRENSIKGPQYIDKEGYTLEVSGLVETPLSLTYDEVVEGNESHEKLVTLHCVEGWSVTILWEGVLVEALLDEAGPLETANTVILHAYDGYTTSFPLEYFADNNILMAHKMNGVVLPPERGFPFQLVAENTWGYKWIKWITRIELSDDADYEGYWESRGYSNEGDLNRPSR
jgi:DMSO/TMAO reductase YedYZ molybdopterin-dependent catalytic subunit